MFIRTEMTLIFFSFILLLSAVGAKTAALVGYQSRTITRMTERHTLDTRLKNTISSFLESSIMPDSNHSLTINELSSKINLNYDNDFILNLPSVKVKLSDSEAIKKLREQALQPDYSLYIQPAFLSYFSVNTTLTPLTSSLKSLSLLLQAKTEQMTVPLVVQNAVNNESPLSSTEFFNALGRDKGLWALTNTIGRFNVNNIDTYLLTDLISHPLFQLKDSDSKTASLLSLRNGTLITDEKLHDILGDEEKSQLIYAYLGTFSSFYEITLKGEQQNLIALVIIVPPVPGEKKITAVIANKRYEYHG